MMGNRDPVPGEIDESRPGGVRTLKQAFEKKNPPLDPNLFQDSLEYHPAKIAFIDDNTEYHSPPPPQRSATEPPPPPGTKDIPASVPPPPPPPPPMVTPSSVPSSPVKPIIQADASASVPMQNGMVSGIRAGRVQWPPKKADGHKSEMAVRRVLNKVSHNG